VKNHHEPGYVLHTRPYTESSLLLDVFCRQYGRFMLLAKGARRQKSGMRGVLMPFKPLLLSWAGKGQLPILTAAESQGYLRDMLGKQLHAAYYANELILKLLHRFDAHQDLYDSYDLTVRSLTAGEDAGMLLRVFEKRLLREIGFGLILDHDVETGERIKESANYRYVPQFGPVVTELANEIGMQVSGQTLIAFQEERFKTSESRQQARVLTRNLIYQQLGGRELRSRKVMHQILRYNGKRGNGRSRPE
jgi:DNA repair protein RecO (recombination protein O)